MSRETKNARKAIYDFLEQNGFDLIKCRSGLRKLLMAYGKEEAGEYYRLAMTLAERSKRHRAIIRGMVKSGQLSKDAYEEEK